MTYSYGIKMRSMLERYRKSLFIMAAGLFLAATGAATLGARAAPAYEWEFTPTELTTNWTGDRTYPTGGVSSVTAEGRDNVAEIMLDSSAASATQFYRTEGIQTKGDFGDSVKVDLFLDEDWDSIPTRSGLWADGKVGNESHVDGPWGILEFTTNNGGYTGWRTWASDFGWTERPDVDYEYGNWVTLQIELDEANQVYNYYIDGVMVGSGNAEPSVGDIDHFGTVILNSYNYGQEDGSDYTILWNGGQPYEESGEITSPDAGAVLAGTVDFTATYDDGDEENDDAVQWAVRAGTCAAGTNTVAGNVDGYSNQFNWNGAEFSASVDMSSLADGEYCFIFNPTDDNVNVRETRNFVLDTHADEKSECKTLWKYGVEVDDEIQSFRNQGDCVSYFATMNSAVRQNPPQNGNGNDRDNRTRKNN